MANKISIATGNLTAAGTWGTCHATGELVTVAGDSTVGTTPSASAAWTPGAGIVYDGVALHLSSRNPSPSTETVTVELWNDTDSASVRTITFNLSELPLADFINYHGGWFFVKWSSTYTTVAAKNYKIRVSVSASSASLRLYTNGTANNWAKLLRTTTTGAPAAGDDMHIMGEYTASGLTTSFTVTMDQTAATDYGSGLTAEQESALSISKGGTLTYGTTAATNYVLRLSGHCNVFSQGTLNIGTSATPIPRGSSAVMEFDCASDGQFGLFIRRNCTVNLQGLSRTSGKEIWRCKLNTNEVATSTSLGVDTDTGWLSGDEIVVASTTRTAAQSEKVVLNGNAGASTIATTAGLTYDHSGTAPTAAEVILLTRNVRIRSVSSTSMTFVDIRQTAVCDFDWAEFYYLGENAQGKRGIDIKIDPTVSSEPGFTGQLNMDNCCVHDCEDYSIYISEAANGNWDIDKLAIYQPTNGVNTGYSFALAQATSQTSWVLGELVIISYGAVSSLRNLQLSDLGGTMSGPWTLIGGNRGLDINDTQAGATIPTTVIHSTSGAGLYFGVSTPQLTFTSLTLWRTNSSGIQGVGSIWLHNLTINSLTAFGCSTSNMLLTFSMTGALIDNVSLDSDASFATTSNIQLQGTNLAQQLLFRNGALSPTVAATNDINVAYTDNTSLGLIDFDDVTFGGTNDVITYDRLTPKSLITAASAHASTNVHRSWTRYGKSYSDAATYNTAAPSEQITPNSASFKKESGSILVNVASGQTVTINAYAYKTAAYNGNQPRLIVKRNEAIGITADTVLDTMTVAVSNWEQLTGTTAAASADGVMEFVVDCDGTAGALNVDDWTVS